MVARLLHDCALYLGPANELLPPNSANAEGHWENVRFVNLNDRILAQFGGWWKYPPSFPVGWEFSLELEPLFKAGEELVGRFHNQDYWGWKDPRNSLTIPFWRRLIPGLKVVVCLRNPLEVSRSLYERGDATSASQVGLWLAYYRQLLASVPPALRIVTHYQSYFHDAAAEIKRVSEWLGLQVSAVAEQHASAHVTGSLRHHQVTPDELAEAAVPNEVLELYLSLCAEAGPVYQRIGGQERAQLEEAMARASTRESEQPFMQMKSSSCESELAEYQAKMASIQALETHQSGLAQLRPINALRELKARIWPRRQR